MKRFDFLIVGAGIFGVSSAIELRKRKYSVALLNPDTIPHHLAASTDISKAVRLEYGSDREYFEMAAICIERWRSWNDLFNADLYNEVGFLMLGKEPLNSPNQSYEKASIHLLKEYGYHTEILDSEEVAERFPALNPTAYQLAHYNRVGGYVESGKVVDTLTSYARELGIEISEHQTVCKLQIRNHQLGSVMTAEGQHYSAGQTIICAGANTPYLLPELKPFMKVTGHPVFHVVPKSTTAYRAPALPVFTADISNTGWYGFPLHPSHGVVKMAKHSKGLELDPISDNRRVTDIEVRDFRDFREVSFPTLAEDPLVFTRRCLYTDTLDGHFWIDQHPEIKGLSVSSGGSGHGMKMGPILGEMTADMAEGIEHRFSRRYRWRELTSQTIQAEEARFVENRMLD
ncbi:MAG: FAD-dependent oxidoreductase [Saprospiraceae bacterium]|nr:FAD-dependent oxidoreductase [Saprospiraceae bacterium]